MNADRQNPQLHGFCVFKRPLHPLAGKIPNRARVGRQTDAFHQE